MNSRTNEEDWLLLASQKKSEIWGWKCEWEQACHFYFFNNNLHVLHFLHETNQNQFLVELQRNTKNKNQEIIMKQSDNQFNQHSSLSLPLSTAHTTLGQISQSQPCHQSLIITTWFQVLGEGELYLIHYTVIVQVTYSTIICRTTSTFDFCMILCCTSWIDECVRKKNYSHRLTTNWWWYSLSE